MGFDNECIVNIQTLAGEYFCPVCRLLIYPHEALQSQCTHLYCKPCLTYVVGTTRACPYDGYLVTEQDSKPLLESNKALAETIGKIPVRCLFYRSGCQWQGPLSDCTSHCSGCAFGNSPVVCNRCAIQIAHRQVQEHAQTCQGVQPQATQAIGTQSLAPAVAATPASGEQPQAATQSGMTNSVTKAPQTGVVPSTVQDPNLQASANPLVYGATPGAVPTPEQLYQQQYYQQYPGYDPYQQAYQNYYPYPLQPQVYAQPPPQVQPYPQPQLQQQPPAQSQTPGQSQAPQQPQGQAQSQSLQNVNPQYQTPNATQASVQMMPPSQGYPHPQSYPGGQPQQPVPPHLLSQPMQMPQFQQPQMQHHPSSHPPPHPQPQTQAHPHQQPMNQAPNPNVQPQTQQPMAHAVSGYNSYPQLQNQQQMQMGAQQRPNLHPQSGFVPQIPPHAQGQYPPQRPQMGIPQSAVPNQQFPHQGQIRGVPPVQQPPANPYGQQPGHPAVQPMQQPLPQQHVFPGQASGPVQNQLHPRGQQMQLPPPPSHTQLHPQAPSGLQPHQHQNYPARPMMPNHGAQPHPFAQSSAGYPGQAQAGPPHLGPNQHLANQNHLSKTNSPLQKNESLSQRNSEKEGNSLAPASGVGAESAEANNLKAERDAKLGVNKDANTGAKSHKEEAASAQPTSNGGKSHEAVGADPKDGADASDSSAKPGDKNSGQSLGQVLGRNPDFPMQYPPSHQQGPAGTMSQPVRPPGAPHHANVPGQPPNVLRPQGPGQFPHSGQPFNLPPNHFQHPPYERPPSEFGGPRMPLGDPTGPFIGRTPLYGTEGQIGQQRPIGPPGNEIFPDPRSRYLDGQSPGSRSQFKNQKDVIGADSSTVGMHDERFNTLTGRAPRILDKEPFGGYGGNHMDRFASRSPGRENAGFPPRNFEGRDSRPFDGGPRPFKFPSEPGFMRGSEFQGPRNIPGHLPFNDPTNFGDFPGPARRGDLQAPENFPRHRPFGEEFGGNMPGHPNLGDRGFRSSYPSAQRVLSNNGWCRICKVDCEGVEGLELHAQTREHQEMAMDLVRSIKMQNSKRQKVSKDRSSFEEPSKRKGSGHEVNSNLA